MPRLLRSRPGFALLAAVLATGLAACATARLDDDPAAYAEAEAALEQRLTRSPDDGDALRDLGIIHVRTRRYARAHELLTRAFARDPEDARTLYHLGLASEALARYDTALRVYGQYPEVPRLSPYRRLLAGRYAALTRRRLQDEVRQRLAAEQTLADEAPEPRVVAVYPLAYQGDDATHAALGMGLAELISLDLANVTALRLVERARVQALLDELRLAEAGAVDPTTAPRVGQLLGAGRLVGGVYAVLPGGTLRLDAALWEADADAPALAPQSGALNRFFDLEKRLVFALLDGMGIVLTPEERQRIEFIPTQNLQAFLAFSRGLEREDAGAFGAAADFFAQAVRLDPGFTLAQDHLDAAQGQALAGGTLEEALAAADALDPALPRSLLPGLDPLAHRLAMMNRMLGQHLVPGLDAREPAAESGLGDGTGPGLLPEPPDPPDQR